MRKIREHLLFLIMGLLMISFMAEAEEENAFQRYQEAAQETIKYGDWKEWLSITADINISDDNMKLRTKMSMKSDTDVFDYSENMPSALRMSGSANMKFLEQTYAWDMEYQDGWAHYQIKEPEQFSRDIEIEPVCFDFSGLTQDMIEGADISGNEITFTVSGDTLKEVGITAVNEMAGISDMQCGDVSVHIAIDDHTGAVAEIAMLFHASLTYQGYHAEADYQINYQFRPVKNSAADGDATETEGIAAEDIYSKYRGLMIEYESRYGESKICRDDLQNVYLTGLCFAELIDFNRDGLEELLLVYEQDIGEDAFHQYTYEIWAYGQEGVSQVDSGELYGSDGGIQQLILVNYNDQTYLLTGSADSSENNYYHGYADGHFGVVREAVGNYDEGSFSINGQAVSIEQWREEEDAWQADKQKYFLNFDEDSFYQTQEILASTKETLSLSVKPSEAAETTEKWKAAYGDVLWQYKEALDTGCAGLVMDGDDNIINRLIFLSINYGEVDLSYAIEDLDGNGMPELIIGLGEGIREIYTFTGEQLVNLFGDYIGDRSNCEICEDRIVWIEGSGGAAAHYNYYLRVNEDGISSNMVEYYYIDGGDMTIEDVEGNKIPFSKEEDVFSRFANLYPVQKLEWMELTEENIANSTVADGDRTYPVTRADIVQGKIYRNGECIYPWGDFK